MSKIYFNATELVGRMPLVRINRPADSADTTVLVELGFYNPMNPVKDRIAVAIISTAVTADKLPERGMIVKGASGNTGVGLTWVGVVHGYKVILAMPSSMSKERRALLRAFGAELVLTEPVLRMCGAVDKAKEIVASTDGAIPASQFANEASPAIHEKTTGKEIREDISDKVDYLVSGISAGGIITGIGRTLCRRNPQIKLVAVEPAESPLLLGGKIGPHKIQGLGANLVPNVLDTNLYNEVAMVSFDKAITQARRAATDEGLFVGISSGAAPAVIAEIAKRPEVADKTIVVIIPDLGERYVSTALFEGLVD